MNNPDAFQKQNTMQRKYIDIHCHPSTKPFLKLSSGLGQRTTSLWETIKYHLALPFVDEWIAKDALDSQSSLEQLSKGDSAYSVVINPVTQMEQQMAKYTPMWLAVLLALPFPKQITNKYFQKLKESDFPFFDKTKEELSFSANTPKVNTITNENNLLRKDELNLVLAIEGGHNLYNNSKYNTPDEVVVDHVRELRRAFRIIYLTLTHLTPSPLANHAFAMKLIGKKKIHHFYPSKEVGVSEIGYKVINECLSGDQRTFIDMKHMSLAARLEFYRFMRTNYPAQPILGTHCGATGLSVDEWKANAEKQKANIQKTSYEDYHILSIPVDRPNGIELRNIQTKFNPTSINLYDEDIEAIVESGGLIGVSFDERILGRGTKNQLLEVMPDTEFDAITNNQFHVKEVSDKEFEKKIEYYNINMKKKTLRPKDLSKDKLRVQNTFKQRAADGLYFLNNLLYMIQVANRHLNRLQRTDNPWNYFALGSDFDGLIDALDCCKTAKKMADFEELLIGLLSEFVVSTESYELYAIDRQNTLQDIEKKMNKLCRENALRFLTTHL